MGCALRLLALVNFSVIRNKLYQEKIVIILDGIFVIKVNSKWQYFISAPRRKWLLSAFMEKIKIDMKLASFNLALVSCQVNVNSMFFRLDQT